MTREQFLSDVDSHVVTVKRDNGVYRHVRAQKPETSEHWFDIVTWPGSLTIRGDMGCWTFSRTHDMFTFFRSKDGELAINPYYWSEKIQDGVNGGRSSAQKFSEKAFREALGKIVFNWTEDQEKRANIANDLTQALNWVSDDGEYAIRRAASEFTHGDFTFDELPDGMVYRYHFIWCLYAIVWTIQMFDRREAEHQKRLFSDRNFGEGRQLRVTPGLDCVVLSLEGESLEGIELEGGLTFRLRPDDFGDLAAAVFACSPGAAKP